MEGWWKKANFENITHFPLKLEFTWFSIKSWCVFFLVERAPAVFPKILRYCCTQFPCWRRTWGGASSFTKTRISQSGLCAFDFACTLVTLALCVRCRRFVTGTVICLGLKRALNLINTLFEWGHKLWSTCPRRSCKPLWKILIVS